MVLNLSGGFIKRIHSILKKTILTGHSAGSPYSTAELMPDELGAMAAVSTSSSYKGAVMLGKIKIPLIHWHGEKDSTVPNTFADGYKACITWYQKTGGGTPTWIPIPNVAHGADVYAYAGNTLKDWIDNLFPPVVIPPKPGIYVDGTWIGETSGTFEGHFIEVKE